MPRQGEITSAYPDEGLEVTQVVEGLEDIGDLLQTEFSTGDGSHIVITRKRLAAAGDYAADDVLSESATVGTCWPFNVGINDGWIVKAMALCSTTGLVLRPTIQLYTRVPTCTLNDNAANTGCVEGDGDVYVGWIDLPTMRDLGTGMSESLATDNTPASNINLPFVTLNHILYGVVITRAAETNEAAGMRLTIILQIKER